MQFLEVDKIQGFRADVRPKITESELAGSLIDRQSTRDVPDVVGKAFETNLAATVPPKALSGPHRILIEKKAI